MRLHELSPVKGSIKDVFRVGRGHGSGNGKTSGKGHKGQNARSGGGVRPGFEGGQMPLHRRLPKRGFNNIFRTRYATVNIGDLEIFDDGSTVDMDMIMKAGLIKKKLDGIKILGDGQLTKKLNISVTAFSKTAKEKIEKIGGKAEVI